MPSDYRAIADRAVTTQNPMVCINYFNPVSVGKRHAGALKASTNNRADRMPHGLQTEGLDDVLVNLRRGVETGAI
tara:strand:- start:643 stop:867 length:225 start_codon:yes stop_codon:yes gene_type:complete